MDEMLQIQPVGLFINVVEMRCPTSLLHAILQTNMPVVLYLGTLIDWSTAWIADHLSKPDSPLVEYLKQHQVAVICKCSLFHGGRGLQLGTVLA